VLVALNFRALVQTISLPRTVPSSKPTGKLVPSVELQRSEERVSADRFSLGPDEEIVMEIDESREE